MKIFKAAQNIINSTPGDFFGSIMQQGVVLVRFFQIIKLIEGRFVGKLIMDRDTTTAFYILCLKRVCLS